MFDQEREHYDYENGRFSNDFQAAFAVSQQTTRVLNQLHLISNLCNEGFSCVSCEWPEYCRFTDAILPQRNIQLVAAFNNIKDATKYLLECIDKNEDYDIFYHLYPSKDEQVGEPNADIKVEDEDIPF